MSFFCFEVISVFNKYRGSRSGRVSTSRRMRMGVGPFL